MSLSDKILAAAAQQLSSNSKPIEDGTWFDSLVNDLSNRANNLSDPTTKAATNVALSSLSANRDKITALGADAFALFLDKLAAGEEQEAANIYLRAVGSADAIIEAMEQGTLGVIEAKRKLDVLWADAWEVVKKIAITGAKLLLPLVIAAL